jgi:hypothetical protein
MKHIAFYFYALYCATLPGPLDEADGAEMDGKTQ